MATKATKATESNGTVNRLPASKPVALIEIRRKNIQVTVEGISPLIVHAWSTKAIRMIEDKQQKKGKTERPAKDPEAEFESCFYRDKEGRSCVKASMFKLAMVTAATSVDDKVNFPKTKIRQAVFVKGDLLPIISPKEPDMRTDPVPVGSGVDIRYRPEYQEWAVDLTLEINEAVLSVEQIVNLLNLAGFAVGIGEWRPEKDGSCGRFQVRAGK
jgi:hypothetical protein